jgi:transposase-like protein
MSKATNKFSPEVRHRAVRMVLDHESDYPSRWSAVVSVADKIGRAGLSLQTDACPRPNRLQGDVCNNG